MKNNQIIKSFLILAGLALFSVTMGCSKMEASSEASSGPVPGSEEAVIEWIMESWHVTRSYANLQYDSNPENMTRIYNFQSPNGRYHDLGHGQGRRGPLEAQ
jgi:hypothetical protein